MTDRNDGETWDLIGFRKDRAGIWDSTAAVVMDAIEGVEDESKMRVAHERRSIGSPNMKSQMVVLENSGVDCFVIYVKRLLFIYYYYYFKN